MAKKDSAIYITVKVHVRHDDIDENEVGELLDDVVSNLDYNFEYKDEEEGTEIVGHEIIGQNLEY